MAYVTLQEFIDYVQVAEGYIDDGDPDQGVISTVYQRRIDAASDYINAILGIRYNVPVPATALIKEICCAIAHYEGEKTNDARQSVKALYEIEIAKLKCIADGEIALLGLPGTNGSVSVVPQATGSGDSSIGTPGIQKVGVFVAKRDWATKLGKGWSPCCHSITAPQTAPVTVEDEVIIGTQINHGFTAGTVIYYDGANYQKAINTGPSTLGYYLVARSINSSNFEIARPMQVFGGMSGLVPGGWYHTSATTAGLLEMVPTNAVALPGAYASNPIAQAMSTTELRRVDITPFQV